jgi:hypothetical protein
MGMGQAAGVAAAIALLDGCDVREINILKLRRALEEQGVLLHV